MINLMTSMMSDLESLENEFKFVMFHVSRFNWKEKNIHMALQ